MESLTNLESADTAATEAPVVITFIVTLMVFAIVWLNFRLW
jgi:hypothetical protein